MALIKATKSPLRCRGYDGRHHIIFTGFRYRKMGHSKLYCEDCYNKSKLDKCSKFFNELIKKVG